MYGFRLLVYFCSPAIWIVKFPIYDWLNVIAPCYVVKIPHQCIFLSALSA